MEKIWYDEKSKIYLLSDLKRSCDMCHKKLIENSSTCYFYQEIGRRHSTTRIFCVNCCRKARPGFLEVCARQNFALISENVPAHAVPILNDVMYLKDAVTWSGLGTLRPEQIQKEHGGAILDKTKFAGRTNLIIGLRSPEEILQICDNIDEKKLLSEHELDKLILNIQTSSIVIDGENRKLLEAKHEENRSIMEKRERTKKISHRRNRNNSRNEDESSHIREHKKNKRRTARL